MDIKRLGLNDQILAEELFLFFQTEDGIKHPGTASKIWTTKILEDENFIALAAIEKNKLIGGLTAYLLKMYKRNSTKALLYEISVKSKYKRQGIGKKMVEYFISILKDMNTENIILITSKTNNNAIRFFEATNGTLKKDDILYEYIL